MIRTAKISDLDEIVAVEAECFPREEAAGRDSFAARIATFGNHFFLLEEEGKIISFVNGMVSDEQHLADEMYHDASLHEERGAWQMIFGVDTLPAFQRKGNAAKVLEVFIAHAREEGRKGLVLTCKEHMIAYYRKFGFVDEGMSDSNHGGAAWHEMRLTF